MSAAGYVRLARLSNTPTCLSNALVGVAIGLGAAPVRWGTLAALAVGVTLLYAGGMALNDLVDRGTDRRERPGRPIPAGDVTVAGAAAFATACLAVGAGAFAPFGVEALSAALVLVAVIVVYDLVHKWLAASVLLMGACRGLVYVAAAVAVAEALDVAVCAWLAGAITAYVSLFSMIARVEARPRAAGPRTWLSLVLPAVVLAPAPAVGRGEWTLAAIGGALAVAWLALAARHALAEPPRVKAAVHAWIAGISLVDMYFLLLLDRGELALIAAACFAATVAGQRVVSGT